MPKKRVRRTEKHWREVLQRYESSGLSAIAFCRRTGIPLSSMQRWRKRLGPPGGAQFVELVPPQTASVASGSWSLDLTLPNGATIRFRG